MNIKLNYFNDSRITTSPLFWSYPSRKKEIY